MGRLGQTKSRKIHMKKDSPPLWIGITTPLFLMIFLLIGLLYDRLDTRILLSPQTPSSSENDLENDLEDDFEDEFEMIELDKSEAEISKPETRSIDPLPDEDAETVQSSELGQLTYQPVAVHPFHSLLQGYGRWLSHSQHGEVWMPQVSRTDFRWRPFLQNGKWHFTQNGWHWQSFYKWGAIPFHYGRWFWNEEPNGWVWVPGREWRPAWVCWRENAENVGWAPIPPIAFMSPFPTPSSRPARNGTHIDYALGSEHFTFVAKSDLLSDNLIDFALPLDATKAAFQSSHSCDRIALSPQRIWGNFGISHQEISRTIGKPIEMVSVDIRNPFQPRIFTRQMQHNASNQNHRILSEPSMIDGSNSRNNLSVQEPFNKK